MHRYEAKIVWSRNGEAFVDNRYSRAHEWIFDGGTRVPASSSPSSVPVPMSLAAAVDPEEAFVASISSCHMLWFLSLAAQQGFVVDRYTDDAYGIMEKNSEGRLYVSRVWLRPKIGFVGERQPSSVEIDGLHHRAHERCFIANSVKSEISIQPD